MFVKARGSLSAKKCHAKRERANSEYQFTVVVITGELIIDHEKLPQFARCFYEKMSQFSVKLRDPLLDDNVLGFLNLSSARNFWRKNFSREEIFESWCLIAKSQKF